MPLMVVTIPSHIYPLHLSNIEHLEKFIRIARQIKCQAENSSLLERLPSEIHLLVVQQLHEPRDPSKSYQSIPRRKLWSLV